MHRGGSVLNGVPGPLQRRTSREDVLAVAGLMRNFPRPWFLAGGWALDWFVGRVTREHGDIERPCLAGPEYLRLGEEVVRLGRICRAERSSVAVDLGGPWQIVRSWPRDVLADPKTKI